jgi:hypothetical protein
MLSRMRSTMGKIARMQRRLWLLQVGLWPALTVLGAAVVAIVVLTMRLRRRGDNEDVALRSERPAGVGRPIQSLP